MMTAAENNHTNELITVARAWYDAGFCVVPSHEDGGKRPYGLWKQHQQTRLPWDELVQLLNTGKYTGIGVLTGTSSGNTEMLEIEGPSQEAVQRLKKIVEKAAAYQDPYINDLIHRVTRGCVEKSAGGGIHFFIRVTDGPALKNTKLAFTPDPTAEGGKRIIAETRGEGGFVIVAPTPARTGHPEGTSYIFARGTTPAGTVNVTSEERDILHFLFAEINEIHDTEPETQTHHDPEPQTPTNTPTSSGESTFDAYRATPWKDILTPHGWTWSHNDGTRDHWTRPGKNISEGTSATTLEDGPLYCFSSNAGLPTEQGLSKAHIYAHYNHAGNLTQAAQALREQGYGEPTYNRLTPWEPNPNQTQDEQEDDYQKWLANVHEKFPKIDWTTLWADTQEEEWIAEPLLAARRLVALYSAPKVGKSLLMLEIAAGIANGRSIFGYPAHKPRRTLYVDFENDPRGDIRTRLIDMEYKPEELDNLIVLSFPNMKGLDSEKGSNELMAAVKAYDCEIVVIDTVSRAIDGEENVNDTWLAFYRHTGLKLKQAGIALIRLDHSGKDESKGQRGGSAKSGDIDAVWRLAKDSEDLYTLTCEAQRFPISETEITLRRLETPLRHEVVGNPYQEKRDNLIKSLKDKKVPKDPELPLREARKTARELGVKFKNSAFTIELWERYCNTPTEWQIPTLQGDPE